MCADGNETDVAVSLSARLVVRPDDRQPSVLACGTGVRLQRARREASDLAEVFFKFLESKEYISTLKHN